MAVSVFNGGWTLAAAGDTATSAGGHTVAFKRVIIVKTTAGTVTFKDGNANTVLTTGSLADGSMTQIELGLESTGLEYDAVSAGSAVVTVIGSDAR